MDCSVLLLYIYTAGSACVLLTIIAWVAHRYGQLYLHCSLIYLGSFQLFLHSDQPLEGEITCSAVSASRGGCIIHAGGGGGFTHWLTDCFDVQPTTTSGNIITQSIIFSFLASANSFVYFASSAATSRWRICMSVIAAFASFSSLAFLSRWAL